MQATLIITMSLHILSAIFWAGSTFALARTGGYGGERLLRAQMGASVVVVLTGGYLWHLLHASVFYTAEQVLLIGVVAAIAAAGVQGSIGGRAARMLENGEDVKAAQSRMAMAQRIAAGLLAITAVCMAAARFL